MNMSTELNSSNNVDVSTSAQLLPMQCCVQYGLELNKIYNESNLETMKRMPDNFVDLTVTSPPYDGLRTYNGYSFPFEDIAKELFRVTKNGGVVSWIVGDSTINGCESLTSFKQALYFKDIGFNVHDTMIYAKNNPVPLTHNRYEQQFEYMFILSKGKPKTFNPIKIKNEGTGILKTRGRINNEGRKYDSNAFRVGQNTIVKDERIDYNIWFYSIGSTGTTLDREAFKHPAIFPEQLCADHIFSWSNEGDIIYDCFGGSGTTAKMAHLMKRNWILSEISSEYVQIAEKRIAPYLAQTSLF
jgi:site-specific DNA-methyltransferase (adenine-specific)